MFQSWFPAGMKFVTSARFSIPSSDQEPGQIKMEVLIADGMSDDGTRQVLGEFEKRFASLRVLDNPAKIVSTGLNRAIREARGEIIIRMDAHTQYAPNYVRSCVEVLNETNAENVGGPALTRADGLCRRRPSPMLFTRHLPAEAPSFVIRGYEGPVDTVPYGCWRKSTLERSACLTKSRSEARTTN